MKIYNKKNNTLIYKFVYPQTAKTEKMAKMAKTAKMNKKIFTRKLKKGSSAKFTRSKKRSSSSQNKKSKSKTNNTKNNDVIKSSIILSNLEKKKKGTLSTINYRSFGLATRMSRL